MGITTQIAVERIIASGKYGTIFLARDKNSHKQMKCVCKKSGYEEGKRYIIQGAWIEHASHGKQFKIEKSKLSPRPSNIYEALSQSDIWPGLTPKRLYAIREYAALKNMTEDSVLESLVHLKGALGSMGISLNLKKGWSDIREHIILLHPLVMSGLSIDEAFIISSELDAHTRQSVIKSPYSVLIAPSASILTAEGLHTSLSVPQCIGESIKPLYYRYMQATKNKGNTGEILANVASAIHRTSKIPLEDIIEKISHDEVFIEGNAYSVIHSIFKKEKAIAKKIQMMNRKVNPELSKIAASYTGDSFFTEEQRKAVKNSIVKAFSVITGGPGTGKTTTIREVIKNIEVAGYKADIVTLSGKAADRASEASGREASTIHSYLGITPTSPRSKKKLSHQAIIVDEASMVDINLLYQLMDTVDETCKIILVGDINQLESIEPGAILEDIKDALPESVTHLTRVQRFSEDSNINNFANNILDGKILHERSNGLYTYASSEESHQLNTNIKIIDSYIKRHGNVNDIQVISPTWKGSNGVTSLNKIIQDMIPRKDENVILLGNNKFYEGDRVLVKKELPDHGLSTGQMLNIKSINYEKNTIDLISGDRPYTIKISDAATLSLAFCITGHSSQGSEFKNVLFSITPQSEYFADKKMLYTIATRAKENLIITTPKGCMEKILHNDNIRRVTFLSELIQNESPKKERRPEERRKTNDSVVAML